MKKILSLAAAIFLVAACGDGNDASAPRVQEVVLPSELATDVQDALDTAIQGEYENEQTYRRVTQDFGMILPFSAIVSAEVQHSGVLAVLYESRGLDVPQSQWNGTNVPRYDSPQAACAAAVQLEKETVARYDGWLTSLDLPRDIARVFTNLRNAAQNNHLPAFERCS